MLFRGTGMEGVGGWLVDEGTNHCYKTCVPQVKIYTCRWFVSVKERSGNIIEFRFESNQD